MPFLAGSGTDAIARLIALRLGEKLGQQVIVDNRAGAGGNLGTGLIAKAARDDYMTGSFVSEPLVNK